MTENACFFSFKNNYKTLKVNISAYKICFCFKKKACVSLVDFQYFRNVKKKQDGGASAVLIFVTSCLDSSILCYSSGLLWKFSVLSPPPVIMLTFSLKMKCIYWFC
jgi:hypothetical protein